MKLNEQLKNILKTVDHTLLSPDATWEDIRQICDDGVEYGTASVCIPSSYVKQAADYLAGKLPVCTVIGFPCGYSITEAKCLEAAEAVRNGAEEVDMVINVGWLKDGKHDEILGEIRAIRKAMDAVKPGRILKVIIETCLLNDDEKIKMCEIVSDSGADFIKTSTGFSKGGATAEDIRLFAAHVQPHVKIKAAGGISSLADAEEFLALGAHRLGTSRIVKLVKAQGSTHDGGY